MDVSFWLMLEAMTVVASGLGAAIMYFLRLVIRSELSPIRQDIEVLRVGVFNHLSHGETPDEAGIRNLLGYPERK